jgi:acetate kinase
MKILVLNSGSSSQKACLYEIGEILPENPPACLWEGKIEFRERTAAISVKDVHGTKQTEEIQSSARDQAVRRLLSTLTEGKLRALFSISEIEAVGHHVVHSGPV